ncbi:MAG TPA: helix-turn-helix transcriptional regulator, partial [Anaeromyxobacteraceae bacterium]|nr:helix-turn-helix transcriptional regulator [Anaeromyxobacteraceae bacterium]
MAEQGREARAAAFGRWLLQERELRGLARQEVARLTKLAPGVIEALESGEAARMPPRAYLVGYLRAYAAAVGLDADDVVLRWQEAEGEEERPAAPSRPRAAAIRVAAAVAVLLAAALAAWLLAGRGP